MSPTFLSRLDAAQKAHLCALGRVRRYPVHSILFFECDAAHDVLVVRTGEIKVSITVDGHEVLLDVLGGGDVLGELSAIDGGRSSTATAWNMADVVAIPAVAFMGFLAIIRTSLSI